MQGINKTYLLTMIATMVIAGIVMKLIQGIDLRMVAIVIAGLLVAFLLLSIAFFADLLPPALARQMARIYPSKAQEHSKLNGVTAADVAARIKENVTGQEAVADALSRQVDIALSRKRHAGVFMSALLLGPKGSGKTSIARKFAAALYGAETDLVEVDCEKLGPDGSVSALNGAVHGRLARDGELVVLLDKVECAAGEPVFVKALETLLEEATLNGARVGGRCTVIMTSDASHAEMAATVERFKDDPKGLSATCRALARSSGLPEGVVAATEVVTSTRPLAAMDMATVCWEQLYGIGQSFGLTIVGLDEDVLAKCQTAWERLASRGTKEAIRWIRLKAQEAFAQADKLDAESVTIGWDPDGDGGDGAIVVTEIAAYRQRETAPGDAKATGKAAPATDSLQHRLEQARRAQSS